MRVGLRVGALGTVLLVASTSAVVAIGGSSAAASPPTILGRIPAYGPASGGTSVAIAGRNFSGATAVNFGTTRAASFSLIGDTEIIAVSPPGTGLVDIVVSTPFGTSRVSSNDKFSYAPSVGCSTIPTCQPVSPSYGPPAGGTSVAITGTNFLETTGVDFGSTPAASFTIVSDTSITATTPAGTAIVDVTVLSPGGTSPANSSDKFSYAPAVTSVSPGFGPAAGGSTVTITGTNFVGVTAVDFGTNPVGAGQFTVSGTSITATSPSGAGVVNVVVVTSGGTSPVVAGDKFSYAPVVGTLTPAAGPATGGTSVTISGSNFTGATAVDFGQAPATSFTVNSDTTITAVSPGSRLPSATVTVTSAGGTSATSTGAVFTYGPVVALIKPTYGVGSGGTKVTVIGLNFKSVSAVRFGATAVNSFRVKSATKLIAFSPAGTGNVDVTVQSSTAGSSPVVGTDRFDYAPTVLGVTPHLGKPAGGTKVTVTGTNFTGVTSVMFGTTAGVQLSVISSKKLTVVSPPGTGTVDVTVVSLGGTSPLTLTDQFAY